MEPILIATLLLILGAEFVNGWTDAPNSITTVVSTRVLSLKKAVVLATLFNIVGAMSGTAVAKTIGKDIIDPNLVNLHTVSGAMVGIIIWSTLAWYWGIPTSESHALVAGLAGAGFAVAGSDALVWEGWRKVILGLFFSTFLGTIGALLLTKLVKSFSNPLTRHTSKRVFGKLQMLSAAFMAFSHGSNDGQKFMGAFTLALVLGGTLESFSVPLWVILLIALTMGAGTALGGWRIIRTLGYKMTSLEPFQGFSAETAAASTIIAASRLGIPLSTTHTIGTSIMGSSLGHRPNSLKLGVVKNIIVAWILTFPICASISYATTTFLIFLLD